MFDLGLEFFMKLRREALRRRVWFRVLSTTERALLYLVLAQAMAIEADFLVHLSSVNGTNSGLNNPR